MATDSEHDDKRPPEPSPFEDSSDGETATTPSPMDRLFALKAPVADDREIGQLFAQQVSSHLKHAKLDQTHNVLLLHDDVSISQMDANRIYSAARTVDKAKPLLLIVNSPGGDIASAYQIAKVCREHTEGNFAVAIPRRAKSAATLICCGADTIHMGSLSELGPIDPQFGGIPALAYKHSLEHIAELATKYPAASSMFSDYLQKTLPVQALGYFERVAASATQYADLLLSSRRSAATDARHNAETARRLVYSYKDHGFVIDAREAAEIFGTGVVVCNTPEYAAASDVFESIDLMSWYCRTRLGWSISMVGDASSCMVTRVTQ